MPTYSPIIQQSDLETIIYPEILTEITRNDGGTLVGRAIALAIAEAKIYLSRYDLVALFGDPVANTAATFPTPDDIKDILSNIACWKLIRLCNVNVLYESIKEGNDHALHTLRDIQKGIGAPQWPIYEPPAPPTTGAGQVVIVNTRPRNTSGYCDQTDYDQ